MAAAGNQRSLAGRTALAIFAHPDDESLACGGTLARLADAGARVVLICASRGERGRTVDPSLVPGGDLGAVRSQELHEAAKVLGISDVLILNHPDGDLRWDHVRELHRDIVAAIAAYKPEVVITFDEDGLYWHLDHIGVYERTSTAVASLGADAPALYHVTMPRGVMRELAQAAAARGWAPAGSTFWGIAPELFGLETDHPTLTVDVRDWAERKLAALRCHRTQVGPASPFACIEQADARRWLGVELFRRASAGSGETMLEQIGEPVLSS